MDTPISLHEIECDAQNLVRSHMFTAAVAVEPLLGISYLKDGYWWEAYSAGILVVLIVIAFNFTGDAL